MPRPHSRDMICNLATCRGLIGTPEAALSLRQRYDLEPIIDDALTVPALDEMTTLEIHGIRWGINRVQRRMDVNARYSNLCYTQLRFIHEMNVEKNSKKVESEIMEKHPEIFWAAMRWRDLRVLLADTARQMAEDIGKFAEEMMDCRCEMQLLEGQLEAETQKCRECYLQILREYGLMTGSPK
ncbi:uncharacterized protein LAJ45_01156 [Morchella importuna]|uniref:uncharacterized protein n=1 Tax=Morchella importuna TaxID=1174673 RepID=UPI001E8D76E2|nr:uncharacterized protein LAJ45_01156 [Morchella importuna]KAH8154628.1 hypothetical protein LAJ45_01156 [Morchella importuna]